LRWKISTRITTGIVTTTAAAEMAAVGCWKNEAPVKNASAAGTGRAASVAVSEMPNTKSFQAKKNVPLAAPGVFTAAILTFFFAWNDFVFGISLTATDNARPVPAALAFFTGASFFQQPTAAISAAAVVVTIPVVILVLVFQRKIVAGLTSGAVKG